MSQARVRLISAARHCYAGRLLHIGDEFDALNRQDAEDLVALHFATLAPVVLPVVATTTERARRTYRRRDLKAEE